MQNSSVPPPLWQTYAEKATEVYWPVLDAFAKELERVCGEGSPTAAENCKQLIRYLVGVRDFYKVIATPKKVSVQCFNMHGTLHGAKTPLPTAINSINNKNGGQYSKTVALNRGYNLNFRLHNASSKIEPSLKFAISAISFPTGLFYQEFDLK